MNLEKIKDTIENKYWVAHLIHLILILFAMVLIFFCMRLVVIDPSMKSIWIALGFLILASIFFNVAEYVKWLYLRKRDLEWRQLDE